MKFFVPVTMLLVFSISTAFANGGPSFDQLHNQTKQAKRVVQLIDPSSKGNVKSKICIRNLGTTIKQVPC